MKSVYENVGIGHFIQMMGFRLGFDAARTGEDRMSGINLLQQTPMDRPLGDILETLDGLSILIEFKSPFGSLTKERHKLKLLKEAIGEDEAYKALSVKAHWFCVVGTGSSGKWGEAVKPYLSFEDKDRGCISLTDFVKAYVDASKSETSRLASKIGLTKPDMQRYIQLLKGTFAGKQTSSSGGGPMILVAHLNSDGKFGTIVLPNIESLLLSQQDLLQLEAAQQQPNERVLEPEPDPPSTGPTFKMK